MTESTVFTRRNEERETKTKNSSFVSCASFLRVNPLSSSPPQVRNGFTFIELLVVSTILLILASAVMPLARVTVQRQREMELHRALREIRTAIDKYKPSGAFPVELAVS